MSRRRYSYTEATPCEMLAVIIGFIIGFPFWIIVGAILWQSISWFGFIISAMPLVATFILAAKAGSRRTYKTGARGGVYEARISQSGKPYKKYL
jgi:hypothetical protein